MKIESFKQLTVWQKSIILVREVYVMTEKLPKSELFSLSLQMRRSAISIPSNIAEGYKRRSRKEYIRFLSIANASAAELETQVIICQEVYSEIDFSKISPLIQEVQKMLHVLQSKLRS